MKLKGYIKDINSNKKSNFELLRLICILMIIGHHAVVHDVFHVDIQDAGRIVLDDGLFGFLTLRHSQHPLPGRCVRSVQRRKCLPY